MLLPKEIEWMKKRKWNKNYDKGGGEELWVILNPQQHDRKRSLR